MQCSAEGGEWELEMHSNLKVWLRIIYLFLINRSFIWIYSSNDYDCISVLVHHLRLHGREIS